MRRFRQPNGASAGCDMRCISRTVATPWQWCARRRPAAWVTARPSAREGSPPGLPRAGGRTCAPPARYELGRIGCPKQVPVSASTSPPCAGARSTGARRRASHLPRGAGARLPSGSRRSGRAVPQTRYAPPVPRAMRAGISTSGSRRSGRAVPQTRYAPPVPRAMRAGISSGCRPKDRWRPRPCTDSATRSIASGTPPVPLPHQREAGFQRRSDRAGR